MVTYESDQQWCVLVAPSGATLRRRRVSGSLVLRWSGVNPYLDAVRAHPLAVSSRLRDFLIEIGAALPESFELEPVVGYGGPREYVTFTPPVEPDMIRDATYTRRGDGALVISDIGPVRGVARVFETGKEGRGMIVCDAETACLVESAGFVGVGFVSMEATPGPFPECVQTVAHTVVAMNGVDFRFVAPSKRNDWCLSVEVVKPQWKNDAVVLGLIQSMSSLEQHPQLAGAILSPCSLELLRRAGAHSRERGRQRCLLYSFFGHPASKAGEELNDVQALLSTEHRGVVYNELVDRRALALHLMIYLLRAGDTASCARWLIHTLDLDDKGDYYAGNVCQWRDMWRVVLVILPAMSPSDRKLAARLVHEVWVALPPQALAVMLWLKRTCGVRAASEVWRHVKRLASQNGDSMHSFGLAFRLDGARGPARRILQRLAGNEVEELLDEARTIVAQAERRELLDSIYDE